MKLLVNKTKSVDAEINCNVFKYICRSNKQNNKPKFKLKKAKKKLNVHCLFTKNIVQRKTFSRALHENHLARDNWKYIVTLDEACFYLNDFYKEKVSIYYWNRKEKHVQPGSVSAKKVSVKVLWLPQPQVSLTMRN